MSQTSASYQYGAAITGLVLWGGWAFYVNSKVSLFSGISAGLVQGVFSFTAAFVVISATTKLYNYFDQRLLKLIIPTLVMVIVFFILMLSAHTVARTPEILKTILPNLALSTLFCSFTTYKLVNAKPR